MAEDFRDISPIAALEDELRRNMYLMIRSSEEPLTREDISTALGISIKLAAFHLDKLVDRGLLKAHYAPRKGKAGRSSKFYALSGMEFSVTIPSRQYDLVGSVLVETLEQLDGQEDAGLAVRLARIKGREIAEKLKTKVSTKSKRHSRDLAIAKKSLELLGYEPYAQSGSEIGLKNCPFHSLAKQAPDVVCPINKGLIEGVLVNLGVKATQLSPGPPNGKCCVSVKSRA